MRWRNREAGLGAYLRTTVRWDLCEDQRKYIIEYLDINVAEG